METCIGIFFPFISFIKNAIKVTVVVVYPKTPIQRGYILGKKVKIIQKKRGTSKEVEGKYRKRRSNTTTSIFFDIFKLGFTWHYFFFWFSSFHLSCVCVFLSKFPFNDPQKIRGNFFFGFNKCYSNTIHTKIYIFFINKGKNSRCCLL